MWNRQLASKQILQNLNENTIYTELKICQRYDIVVVPYVDLYHLGIICFTPMQYRTMYYSEMLLAINFVFSLVFRIIRDTHDVIGDLIFEALVFVIELLLKRKLN